MLSLILSLFISTAQAQVLCGTETTEAINACTLNDKLVDIMLEHFPLVLYKSYANYTAADPCTPIADDPATPENEEVTCPPWDPTVNSWTFAPFDVEDPQGLYERLLMNNKPAESVFTGHLNTWKAEKLAIVAFYSRINALPGDIRLHAQKCSLDQPNLALLIKQIKDNFDEAKLSCLEDKVSVVTAELAAETEREDRIKRGKQAREFSTLILDLVAGFNIDRQLTAEQITTMQTTFAPIMALLQAGRPTSAKPLIEAITPDGTIVTQAMKDAILSEYTRAGL